MKRILFFETTTFTGATRVTRTIAKKIRGHFKTNITVINDCNNPKKEIIEAIEHEQPDILFSSFTTINSDVIDVGKGMSLTVVVRSDYKLKDITKAEQERAYESYPKADWIIAQTPEMKQELLDIIPALDAKRIKVMDNPIDEEYILEKASEPNPFPDNGNYHFIWVGRKDPIKDLPTLQKAFTIVHRQYPNTDLTLVTNDPNPFCWIKNADCLVICSISEASPNVLREALFLGTTVISTDCSSVIKELLPYERIVEVGNYLELAEKMLDLVSKRNILLNSN